MKFLNKIRVLYSAITLSLSTINCDESKVNEKCLHHESYEDCYTLYGSQDTRITWYKAQEECKGHGGHLVIIKSPEVQDILFDVLQPITNIGGIVHVWTSGRRSNDTNWYYVNNERVPQDIIDKIVTDAKDDRCAYIHTYLETKTVKTFHCQQNLMTVLCQRSAPCDPDDINYKGLCYHLYQDQSGLDWNRGRQYCRGRHDSDMVYLHITDNGLLLLLNTTKTDIWIGLSSRTWIWVNDTSDIKMNYTKFRGGVSTGKCVIIDPNDNGKWDADDCQDENKYFICERIKAPPPTTTTMTTTITTTSATISKTSSTTIKMNEDGNKDSKLDKDDVKIICTCTLPWSLTAVSWLITFGLVLYLILRHLHQTRQQKSSSGNTGEINGTLEHDANTFRAVRREQMEQREQSVDYEDVTHDINMTITESDADRNYQQIKRQERNAYENHLMSGPYETLATN